MPLTNIKIYSLDNIEESRFKTSLLITLYKQQVLFGSWFQYVSLLFQVTIYWKAKANFEICIWILNLDTHSSWHVVNIIHIVNESPLCGTHFTKKTKTSSLIVVVLCLYGNRLCMFWPINFETWNLNNDDNAHVTKIDKTMK